MDIQNMEQQRQGRSAEQHYSCMTIEDIKALAVKKLAVKDCVLLMWCTNPRLQLGFSAIEAWGFKIQNGRVHLGKELPDKRWMVLGQRVLDAS